MDWFSAHHFLIFLINLWISRIWLDQSFSFILQTLFLLKIVVFIYIFKLMIYAHLVRITKRPFSIFIVVDMGLAWNHDFSKDTDAAVMRFIRVNWISKDCLLTVELVDIYFWFITLDFQKYISIRWTKCAETHSFLMACPLLTFSFSHLR